MSKIIEILPDKYHKGTFDVVDESGDVIAIDLETGLQEFLGATATNGVLEVDETPGGALANPSFNDSVENESPEDRARNLVSLSRTRPDLRELPSDDNRGMYGR